MTTRDQLQRALERFDSSATVSVEGGITLLATVISSSFEGLNEALRQQLVWRHLRAEFDADERALANIEFVFTNAPDDGQQ